MRIGMKGSIRFLTAAFSLRKVNIFFKFKIKKIKFTFLDLLILNPIGGFPFKRQLIGVNKLIEKNFIP